MDRRSFNKLVLGAPVLLGSGLAALGPARAETGVSDTEITLGGIFALSGPVRTLTKPLELGARSYFNLVNSQGGVNGRKLNWLVEDDAYSPPRALAAAKKLVERDSAFMLFGSLGTNVTKVIGSYCDQNNVPFIGGTSVGDQKGKYTFTMSANYDALGYGLVKLLKQQLGAKKIGYFYQNDDVGRNARIGIDRATAELGFSLSADVGIEPGTTDLQATVLKLRDSGSDAVIAFVTGPTLSAAIKAGSLFSYKPNWATYGVADSAVIRSTLGPDLEGLVFASEMDAGGMESEGVRQHAKLMESAEAGAKADYTSMIGYAGAKLVVDALQRAGRDLTREKMLDALLATKDLDVGVMGKVTLSAANQNAVGQMRLYRFENNVPKRLSDWIGVR